MTTFHFQDILAFDVTQTHT